MTTFDPNRADRNSSEREAFQRLLEAYGSDRSRWPAADRLRFAQLLPRDMAARAMLREAAALDQVLDRAPGLTRERHEAMAARLMALAADTPQEAPPQNTGTPKTAAEDPQALLGASAPVLQMSRRRTNAKPAIAALLAASLAAGVLIGLTGAANPLVDAIAGLTDSALSGGQSGADAELEFLLAGDSVPGGGEDLL